MSYILVENETSRLIWTGSRAIIQIALHGTYTDFYVCKSIKSGWETWCCFYGNTQKNGFRANIIKMLASTNSNNPNN